MLSLTLYYRPDQSRCTPGRRLVLLVAVAVVVLAVVVTVVVVSLTSPSIFLTRPNSLQTRTWGLLAVFVYRAQMKVEVFLPASNSTCQLPAVAGGPLQGYSLDGLTIAGGSGR